MFCCHRYLIMFCCHWQQIMSVMFHCHWQLNLMFQNLTLSPEVKIEASMQHEITRLTSENLVSQISSVSVKHLISTWTVFCKANLVTQTPSIFLKKSKIKIHTFVKPFFLSYLYILFNILYLTSNKNTKKMWSLVECTRFSMDTDAMEHVIQLINVGQHWSWQLLSNCVVWVSHCCPLNLSKNRLCSFVTNWL